MNTEVSLQGKGRFLNDPLGHYLEFKGIELSYLFLNCFSFFHEVADIVFGHFSHGFPLFVCLIMSCDLIFDSGPQMDNSVDLIGIDPFQ